MNVTPTHHLLARLLDTADWKLQVVNTGQLWMGMKDVPTTSPAIMLGPISGRGAYQLPVDPTHLYELVVRLYGATPAGIDYCFMADLITGLAADEADLAAA